MKNRITNGLSTIKHYYMKIRSWIILIFIVLFYACNAISQEEVINGVLEVPENRTNSNSRTLKLAYKVLKAKTADSSKAPIAFLYGGPGGAALTLEGFWAKHPLRNDRDIVLMDQRGTGASGANGTEVGEAMFNIARQDLDIDAEIKMLKVVFSKCKERMQHDGVDLTGYTTKENAADFEDLRKELAYEKWNLLGISYGSRLGLTIMDDFPQGVRTAVFSAVSPSGTDYINDHYRNIEQSLLTVLRRCENNKDCNTRYPNLKERFIIALEQLQSDPMHVEYEGEPFIVNTQDALLMVTVLLYNRPSIGYIPFFIEALENRETAVFINFLKGMEHLYKQVNWPVNRNITGYDKLPFYDEAKMTESLQQSEILSCLATSSNLDVEIVKHWHLPNIPSLKTKAVVSNIPTLLISGGLDPVTPTSNATETLKHLKNGYEVIFLDESHSQFNPCFFQIIEEFLNNPLQKPNIECSSVRNSIEWYIYSSEK